MERALTKDELRIAARQAITLASSMNDENARNDLLLRAQRLLEEAETSPDFDVRETAFDIVWVRK